MAQACSGNLGTSVNRRPSEYVSSVVLAEGTAALYVPLQIPRSQVGCGDRGAATQM